ncbi:alanine racemase [Kiloniella laminariae]|uniref:Alanine racemase n=1 Tax=Kiloniella laminariae TaxID=454162 RepID=A0ABT4LFN4_9PROT|nr:alanine racemase [Kiloniella laminariae]MCZ4279914.1 alanine racemase [Kiloniella laminariae]
MRTPRIEVDLGKILYNTRQVVQQLKPYGIGVTAVTKAVCGHPDIARAMLDGGAVGLADARIENLERLKHAGISCPLTLIRTPMPSEVSRVIQACDTSYNTELDTIYLLAQSARQAGRVHDIVLMVEMGDLREGIMPGDLQQIVREVMTISGVQLKGIAANFACLNATGPDAAAMAMFSELARHMGQDLAQNRGRNSSGTSKDVAGIFPEIVSGGNSTSLPGFVSFPCEAAQIQPEAVNDLRLGEAILLGVQPLTGAAIKGLFTDAFTLVAEIIEHKVKPIIWTGPVMPRITAQDRPDNGVIPGAGQRRQSILALGYQDTDIRGLTLPSGNRLVGATSDHLVMESDSKTLVVGAEIPLRPNYSALMRAMAAGQIHKVTKNRKPDVAKFHYS